MPRGFPGPGGTGSLPSRPGRRLRRVPPRMALLRHDLPAPERRRIRRLAGRNAEDPLERRAVVEVELLRLAPDHEHLAEVVLGHRGADHLERQLERLPRVLAQRERQRVEADDLLQPPAVDRRGALGHEMGEPELRVDGVAPGLAAETCQEPSQASLVDLDAERDRSAGPSRTESGFDRLANARTRPELGRREPLLPGLGDHELERAVESQLHRGDRLPGGEPAHVLSRNRDPVADGARPDRSRWRRGGVVSVGGGSVGGGSSANAGAELRRNRAMTPAQQTNENTPKLACCLTPLSVASTVAGPAARGRDNRHATRAAKIRGSFVTTPSTPAEVTR